MIPNLPLQSLSLRLLAASLGILAIAALIRGMRECRWSMSHPGQPHQSARMIHGIRLGIVAIALACFAVALLRHSGAWAIFGAVFLAEELVETGVMLLAMRRGERPEETSARKPLRGD
jgi:hypothetical protein